MFIFLLKKKSPLDVNLTKTLRFQFTVTFFSLSIYAQAYTNPLFQIHKKNHHHHLCRHQNVLCKKILFYKCTFLKNIFNIFFSPLISLVWIQIAIATPLKDTIPQFVSRPSQSFRFTVLNVWLLAPRQIPLTQHWMERAVFFTFFFFHFQNFKHTHTHRFAWQRMYDLFISFLYVLF